MSTDMNMWNKLNMQRQVELIVTPEINGKILALHLEGKLDYKNQRIFREVSYQILKDNPDISLVEINCVNVTYIDSSGFGALLLLRSNLTEVNKELTINNARPEIKELFKNSQFASLFKFKN